MGRGCVVIEALVDASDVAGVVVTHWHRELAADQILARLTRHDGQVRLGQTAQHREPLVAQVARKHGHAGHALAEVADDVHRSHRAGGTDDVDLIVGPDFSCGRDGGKRIGDVRAGRASQADAAIMDAPDL